MANVTSSAGQVDSVPWKQFRSSLIGVAGAAVAAVLGVSVSSTPDEWPANVAALLGVAAMIVAGYAVSRRPKLPGVLFLAAATALLAGFATNPAWDSIRLMQFVMAGIALTAGLIVLLPPAWQKFAVSVVVIYHFAGITSAITSPTPTPWLTAQLWARVFRPHLEFNYVNNAYHFYSPQPGPAQVLWFCITGDDDRSCWYKLPRRSEMLDPLSIEYFRRLSLTERARQPVYFSATQDNIQSRLQLAHDFPLQPNMRIELQHQPPGEHARHIFSGYARHVANVIGTGRRDKDGNPIPVKRVKIYLAQHEMLNQNDFRKGEDPYSPDTYRPIFEGEYDPQGRLVNPYDPLLFWMIPILKDSSGTIKNYVTLHATPSGDADPFKPEHEWGKSP